MNCLKPVLVTVLGASLLLPGPVAAQQQPESGDWTWRASIYGWLPDIDGKTEFPSGEGGPSIGIDASQLLDNLDFTFQGAIEATNGTWGVLSDLIYLDEGASRTGYPDFTIGAMPPSQVEANVTLDLKSWIWSLAGTWTIAESSTNVTQLLAGTRMLDMSQDLDWEIVGETDLLPGRSGRSSASFTNWDIILGVKGRYSPGAGGRWVLPYYLDIGVGDSDLTLQALAGIGYGFDWGTVTLNYRYLDYDLDSGPGITDLTLQGPVLGATFAW